MSFACPGFSTKDAGPQSASSLLTDLRSDPSFFFSFDLSFYVPLQFFASVNLSTYSLADWDSKEKSCPPGHVSAYSVAWLSCLDSNSESYMVS